MDYGELIAASYSAIGLVVTPIGPQESICVVDRFIERCVAAEFRTKIVGSFNRHKPITNRFFVKYEECRISSKLEDLVPNSGGTVVIRTVWGSLSSPACFILKSTVKCLTQIFVDEGDAIAEIEQNERIAYLFLGGSRGDLYLFRSQ